MKNTSTSDTSSATQTFTYGVSGNRFGYNTDGNPKWTQTGQFGQWDRTGYTLLGWSTSKTATEKTWGKYSNVSDSWINNRAPSITLYAVWADQTAPTCSISKSNTYTTSGVTVRVSCSDSGSGCARICTSSGNCSTTLPYTFTGVKSSATYTIYDKAGNSKTCTASISTTKRYRKKTCSTCSRCSSAGCSSYSSWTYTSSGSGMYTASDKSPAYTKTYEKLTCTLYQSPNLYQCKHYTRTCSTYNQSCSSCGCSSWGSWSGYSYSSCSSSSSTQCESTTVYY